MKLLTIKQLPEKGIDYSRPTIAKLEAAGQFPRHINLSARRQAWLESEIDSHIAALAAARGG
jgi:prophage regulatory protein